MDDLYVYLRARANDASGRARPAKHEDKPEAYTKAEESPAWAEVIDARCARPAHADPAAICKKRM